MRFTCVELLRGGFSFPGNVSCQCRMANACACRLLFNIDGLASGTPCRRFISGRRGRRRRHFRNGPQWLSLLPSFSYKPGDVNNEDILPNARQRKGGSELTLGAGLEAALRTGLQADDDGLWRTCGACRRLIARGSLRPLRQPMRQRLCISAGTGQSKTNELSSTKNSKVEGYDEALTLLYPD